MPPLRFKEPKVIIMDMLGTAVKLGFIDKILIPYIKNNINEYLKEKWDDKRLKKDVERLRKEAVKDEANPKILGSDAPVADQQKSVADYILAAIETKKESAGISSFRFNMWFYGYKKKRIVTPIYSDVAFQLSKWRNKGIKLYVLSNGWKEANKKFLSQTSHGDLNLIIDGHFDTSEGQLDSKETYTKIVEKVGHPIEECLFLTKSGKEGMAAKEAGMSTILVLTHRRNIQNLTDEERSLPRIRTFNELEFGDITETPQTSPDENPPTSENEGEGEKS